MKVFLHVYVWCVGVVVGVVCRKEEGQTVVDGGALVLARGGVAFLGHLQQMKKDKSEKLQRSELHVHVYMYCM